MAHGRFSADPLIQVPLGALRTLIDAAHDAYHAGDGLNADLGHALSEAQECITAQSLETWHRLNPDDRPVEERLATLKRG